ncbi:hypothetical protein KDA_19480 [Dictyobacter alpinus]|uniref:Peptidase C51 domain-containing protein n=1 Tax=Dictyobacter alpinus TaxID=2014873 RepID=A0A402B540_9CHLR|nr:CHAP domain-containing protein [Dictyobacter alpinus]GCE26464.1 hypothetical protein KDA_19480 [Dictyobacter alpinus]
MSLQKRHKFVRFNAQENEARVGDIFSQQPAIQHPTSPDTSPIQAVPPSAAKIASPGASDIQTGEIQLALLSTPSPKDGHTTNRLPIVIPGNGTKNMPALRPRQKKGPLVHVSIGVLIIAMITGTLLAFMQSVDSNGKSTGLSIFQPGVGMKVTKKNETALISAQAATATAVMQDGFGQPISVDIQPPAASKDFVPDASFVNNYLMGQCTYWADFRYHQLTGYAIPWMYDAKGWAYGASQSPGWVVSPTPKVPSIIVLQPGTQGAGLQFGHVAIVERINPDGTLYTSAWNVVGPGILTYMTYHITPGVSFVWHS